MRRRRRRRWHYNPIKEISHVADCCQHSGRSSMIQLPDIIHFTHTFNIYTQVKSMQIQTQWLMQIHIKENTIQRYATIQREKVKFAVQSEEQCISAEQCNTVQTVQHSVQCSVVQCLLWSSTVMWRWLIGGRLVEQSTCCLTHPLIIIIPYNISQLYCILVLLTTPASLSHFLFTIIVLQIHPLTMALHRWCLRGMSSFCDMFQNGHWIENLVSSFYTNDLLYIIPK